MPARRFPLGAAMPAGVAPFRPEKEPIPLDEIEEAMLVMAGGGWSSRLSRPMDVWHSAR